MPTHRLPVAAMAVLPLATFTAAALAQTCDPSDLFAPQVLYDAGRGPQSVAIGDLDGDGHADLAVANFSDDKVSVLLNNGDGTFAEDTVYGVGLQPASVAIGDLDGDGHADLAVAIGSRDSVSVLLNNGDGTFGQDTLYGAGDAPRSVAIGDLDGDGDADLAVANNLSDSVSVLLNNGDGTFAQDILYGAGDAPLSVAIGDLDGDGDADLAVANRFSNNVSVLLNNTSEGAPGTFAQDILYGAGSGPLSVAIGDLDGDGDADLVVANSGSDDVSVLLNTGVGTFAEDTLYGAGFVPVSVAIGDLDGDADADLAIGNFNSNNVSVLLNNTSQGGPGTFAEDMLYGAGNGPQSVAIGDLDGDGNAELAVANRNSDNVSVLLNRCVSLPTITTQPVPVVLLPAGGGVAELGVVATGTGPLTYQWRRSGVPLADGAGVSGATTPTLTIDATVEDIAGYDVVVTNAAGSETSDLAVIAVPVPCRSDFNDDGVLNIFDFLAFQNAFDAGCP